MIFIPEDIKPPGRLLAFPKFEGVVAWPDMARGHMAAVKTTPHFTRKDTSEGLLDGPAYRSRYVIRARCTWPELQVATLGRIDLWPLCRNYSPSRPRSTSGTV